MKNLTLTLLLLLTTFMSAAQHFTKIWEGKAVVPMKDTVGCTKGEIAYVSDTAGRAASTSTRATAGYKAIGVFTETLAGGTDVLAEIIML